MPGGNIVLSTAETSADLHAGQVARQLSRMAPRVRLLAMGGTFLRNAGANIIVDIEGRAVMGLVEVVGQLRFFRRAARVVLEQCRRDKPAAVVLVDAPAFHLPLARQIKRHCPDVPIVYYIAPKAWAWGERRVEKIRERVDKLLCIFPFEVDWFAERGVKAEYVGNPTLDELRPLIERSEARRARRTDSESGTTVWQLGPFGNTMLEPLISLFPGSRRSEIARLWPVLRDAAERLRASRPRLKFAVALSEGMKRQQLEALGGVPPWVLPVNGRSQELLSESHLALVKSGTVTLEAALLGVPMVVSYKMSTTTGWIARRMGLNETRLFSLPNILAGRAIVPEFMQERATGENLATAALRFLDDNRCYAETRAELEKLRETLGDRPAARRTAEAILTLAMARQS